MFNDIYRKRRVLVTGYTQFEGSWLALWLDQLGAEVCGFSVKRPKKPNHAKLLNLEQLTFCEDVERYEGILRKYQPEIVFHLAGQPIEMVQTTQKCESVRVLVISEKKVPLENAVMENGGHAKETLIAVCQAGTVMGGGDWTEGRLIPEMMLAASRGKTITIHNASTTCPQNHVLDIVTGYLTLGQHLLQGKTDYTGSWSLGDRNNRDETVGEMLHLASMIWNRVRIELASQSFRSAQELRQPEKAVRQWVGKPIWGFGTRVEKTVEWYKRYYEHGEIISWEQLDQYIGTARHHQAAWTDSEPSCPAWRKTG